MKIPDSKSGHQHGVAGSVFFHFCMQIFHNTLGHVQEVHEITRMQVGKQEVKLVCIHF